MDDFTASWARTHRHLTDASAALPPSPTVDELAAFDEYLMHNELALALDELAQIAEQSDAAAVCWEALRAAVEEMALTEEDDVHGASVRLVRRRTEHRE